MCVCGGGFNSEKERQRPVLLDYLFVCFVCFVSLEFQWEPMGLIGGEDVIGYVSH